MSGADWRLTHTCVARLEHGGALNWAAVQLHRPFLGPMKTFDFRQYNSGPKWSRCATLLSARLNPHATSCGIGRCSKHKSYSSRHFIFSYFRRKRHYQCKSRLLELVCS